VEDNKHAQRHETLQMIGMVVLFTLIAAGTWWVWGRVTQADDNSRSAASPNTTPTADVEAEVEAAYRAYVAMQERVQAAPDPDDPEIPERATGSTLERLRQALADYAARGQAVRVGPATRQTILSIEVSGDRATVRACYVDESGVFDVTTGAEVVPVRIGTSIDTTVLERTGDVWRVSSRRPPAADEQWEGVTTCEQ
jgi:hypothetical protein